MRIELAQFAFEKESYNTSIRECQDCVELLVKSLLISFGQFIPEKHNLKREHVILAKKAFADAIITRDRGFLKYSIKVKLPEQIS